MVDVDGVDDGVYRYLPAPVAAAAGGSPYAEDDAAGAVGSGSGCGEAGAPALCVRSVQYTEERCARGVFALRRLERGTLVEAAHCIHIPPEEVEAHTRHTVFEHYVFKCKGAAGGALLALGLGSLFNHSDRPNLDYRIDEERQIIRYYAATTI